MKLATILLPGERTPRAALVEDDGVRPFGGPDGVREVLAGARPEPTGARHPLAEVTLLAPIPTPDTVYAIGLNYAEHVRETGASAPEKPIVFVKTRNAITRPGGPIIAPAVTSQLDYEGELVIVIGAGGAIGGFCIADDVSARDLQFSENQWTRGKGADTFCPFGPWITTVDEVPSGDDLRLRTWVNDELRQDTRTSDLIFGCQSLVDFIAETNTLAPGDLILTGTPSGVGMGFDPPRFLSSGDRIRIAIEGLGEIAHAVA